LEEKKLAEKSYFAKNLILHATCSKNIARIEKLAKTPEKL
jgi:hypothetical protein